MLYADKVGTGAETMITTPGAGECHSWIRTANLFETNQPPSKFIYQVNGEEKAIVVIGEKDKFLWVDGGPVMLPGGYSSIGISLANGSKAAVDCVDSGDETGVGYGRGILVFGSFVTAGDARALLKSKTNEILSLPKEQRVSKEEQV